jgi:hypothetical protein
MKALEDALAKVQNYGWLFEWGMYLFLLATLGIAIWIFFDSTNKNKGEKALTSRILSIVGVFLIAPAFIFRYTGTFDGVNNLARLTGEIPPIIYPGAINWNVRWLLGGYGPTIALVALLGVIVSIVAVIVYASTVQRARPSTEFMGALNNRFAELERGIGGVASQSTSASVSANSVPAPMSRPASAPSANAGAATIFDKKAPTAATIIERPASGASLRAIAGANTGQAWNLPAQDIKLGRDSSSFIVLSDGKASREHAKLLYNGGNWAVIDLGSANSTYVNEVAISGQQYLNTGDQIRIGDSVFAFTK